MDAIAEVAVDAVADSKVNARSGATIRRMRVEIIMEMFFKRGSMLGCDIYIVKSVDVIPPILLDFMPLGRAILALLSCLLNMIIGIFRGRLLVLQLALEPLREAERALNTNAVWVFLN